MSETHLYLRRYVATGVVYLALVGSVLGFNVIRARGAQCHAAKRRARSHRA